MSRIILVSNRLPWTVSVHDGQGDLLPSSGGLATALAGTHAQGDTLWVGWPGDLSILSDSERERILSSLRERRFVPLELNPKEVERYYEGFSNGVLWPMFHYLLDKVRLDADLDWDAYASVNERFATAVAETAEPDDLVWVHDYQLMLVPKMLRELRPDLRIGFFLHIPFPAHEVFRILPWRESLLQGLLASDLVGFHTSDYQDHFATCTIKMLGAEETSVGVHYKGKTTCLSHYAIGIDADAFSALAANPLVQQRAAQIRHDIGGRKLLVGVDRLDYTKGIPRRLLAFERFLEQHPQAKDEVLLLQAAVPSRQGVEAYSQFRKQVDEIAGRINGQFGGPTRVPIHLLHQALPFEELVALYCAADTMLVTPLRDGMNLVAKEFCATRNDDSGVLVLSEFAGAAAELKGSLLVNPYDIGSVAGAIERTLQMDPREVGLRMRALRRRVFQGNVHRWAADFIRDLEDVNRVRDVSVTTEILARLLQESSRVDRIDLMLDYDGTLVPFTGSPEAAFPDDALLSLLRRLSELPGINIHLVSGRSREVLDAWFSGFKIALHAEHGYWHKPGPGSVWESVSPQNLDWKDEVNRLLASWLVRYPDSLVEPKASSTAWHFRKVPGGISGRQIKVLRNECTSLLERYELEIIEGVMVLEFRPKGIQKGMAVGADMFSDRALVVAIGDDLTDEDLFRSIPPSGFSIRVGQGPSSATYRLPNPESVRGLLELFGYALADSLTQEGGKTRE